jgi:hypothetical protein
LQTRSISNMLMFGRKAWSGWWVLTSVLGPVNLGNPTEIYDAELAGMLIDVTGSKSKLVYRPMPQDDPKQRQPNWLGIWKIREAGGQKPECKKV